MAKYVRRLLVVTIGALALAVVAYASTTREGRPAASPIKFASILSLTGPTSTFGILNKQGIDTAVNYVNSHGGIKGHPLEVTYFDDQSRPETAAAVAEQAGSDASFVAVVGTGSTTITAPAVVAVLNRLKVPTISNIATGYRTDFDGDWIFHYAASYDLYALSTMDVIHKYLRKNKLGLLFTTDIFGKAQFTTMKGNEAKFGLKVVAAEGVPSNIPDATPAITRLIQHGAQVIVAIAVTAGADTVFANNWANLGSPVPMIGNVGYTSPAVAKLAEQPVKKITAMPGFILANKPLKRQRAFVSSITKAGFDPQFLNGQGWDGVMMLAKILRTGRTSHQAIKLGLETLIKGYQGTNGVYTFDKTERQAFNPRSMIWLRYLGDGNFGYYPPWAKHHGL